MIEALIRAGAMDALAGHKGLDRSQLMATVALAMDAAEQAAANAMQGGLFDLMPEAAGAAPEFAKIRPWTERERLKEEKLAIGFFLSGHPFNAFRSEVRRFVRRTLAQIEPSRDITMLAGVVMEQRTKVGNRGKMAFVQLDDGTAIDPALLDSTLSQLPARLGDTAALPGGARISEAIALLGELSRSDELTDFLTLPAYARID